MGRGESDLIGLFAWISRLIRIGLGRRRRGRRIDPRHGRLRLLRLGLRLASLVQLIADLILGNGAAIPAALAAARFGRSSS